MKKHISNLVLYNGDDSLKKGMATAYLHYKAGILSETPNAPIVVQKIEGERGKYLVIDGYHRIMEGLMRGERSFNCRFSRKKYDWWVPTGKHRFELPKDKLGESKRYKIKITNTNNKLIREAISIGDTMDDLPPEVDKLSDFILSIPDDPKSDPDSYVRLADQAQLQQAKMLAEALMENYSDLLEQLKFNMRGKISRKYGLAVRSSRPFRNMIQFLELFGM